MNASITAGMPHDNILLLTDDQNAVEEAHFKYPGLNWIFIDCPRHKGAEGGWENQVPSDNPKFEVVVLLTIFWLVCQCSSLVHSHGNFAHFLYDEMFHAKGGESVNKVDLDQVGDHLIFDANNSLSVNISRSFSLSDVESPSPSNSAEALPDSSSVSSPEDNATSLCFPWNVDTDHWWTHHVDWEISMENDTHYCFSKIQDEEKADYLRRLYDIQFNSNCMNITTKQMWSSGWGANFINVQDGLHQAMATKKPTQFLGPWHYAAKKDESKPVCPQKDMYCYFLNLTNCEPDPDLPDDPSYKKEGFNRHVGLR